MLSIGNWMKLCILERFPRHLVISYQFLRSPALWKLLLLVGEGEQEWDEAQLQKAGSLCHKLSVGYWKLYKYPFGKLTPIKKKVQYFFHCRIVFCSGICLVLWGEGTSYQRALYGFSAWASLPHTSLLCSPGVAPQLGAAGVWLPSPKCQRGLTLLSELAPGNLLQGSKVECPGARDPEPGQSLILLLLLALLLLLLLLLLLFSSRFFWFH